MINVPIVVSDEVLVTDWSAKDVIDAVATTMTFKLPHQMIKPGSVTVKDNNEPEGTIDAIDYATGELTVTFQTQPNNKKNVLATYTYYKILTSFGVSYDGVQANIETQESDASIVIGLSGDESLVDRQIYAGTIAKHSIHPITIFPGGILYVASNASCRFRGQGLNT